MKSLHGFQVQQELCAKICAIGRTEGSKGTFIGVDKLAGQQGRRAAACCQGRSHPDLCTLALEL